MRVLWISGLCPLPLTDGHRQRIYHLLRSVARRHATTLLCQVRAADSPFLAELAGLCERVITVPQPEGKPAHSAARAVRRVQDTVSLSPTCFLPAAEEAMRRELSDLAGAGFDIAVGSLYCASLVFASAAPRRVLDCQNVEGDLYRRLWLAEVVGPRRLSRMLDWVAVNAFERRMLPRADLVTACSERDRELLRRRIPARPPVVVIPNGVELGGTPVESRRREQVPGEETLVFAGGMSYAPNVDAAVLLVREIMPRVWDSRPEVRLYLVGKDPHPRVRTLAGKRVTVTGAVPEMRPYLDRAALAVVPLRSGGGTRLKILEAMAAGVPVVSSSLGAEGIDVVPGREIAIADGPQAFAAAILDLLSAPDKARCMALAARGRVEAGYGWEVVGDAMVAALERCHANPLPEKVKKVKTTDGPR